MSSRQERGAQAHRTGMIAEDGAVRALESDGFTILARRYRSPHGEIDIVAQIAETLVFVEVKARPSHATAAQAISRRQWQRLEATALHYIAEKDGPAMDMRFDVVLVDAAGRCERIENAYSFDEW